MSAPEKRKKAATKLTQPADEPLQVVDADGPLRPEIELKRLVQELEVHQLELEMQNEELRQVQEALETSRNAYAELYDFAPAGYFSFDRQGLVRRVNLRGARLLGLERQCVLDKPMSLWIADADGRELFSKHCAEVLNREKDETCEIWLQRSDGIKFFAHLRSIAEDPAEGTHEAIRAMIVDVTEQIELKTALQNAHDSLEHKVTERTRLLLLANERLVQEIAVRKDTEESLRKAFKEIKLLKDRLLAENVYLQHEIARKFNFGEIIGRFRADGEVSYLRAALLKAQFSRRARLGKPSKEVSVSLDPSNTNVGYRLGRLFAVLEKAQQDALPGINATIKDRFYGAASATPASVFPRLIRMAQHYISKAEFGVISDRRMGDILETLPEFPRHMDLDGQAMFALGYYHQRNDIWRKKTNVSANSSES